MGTLTEGGRPREASLSLEDPSARCRRWHVTYQAVQMHWKVPFHRGVAWSVESQQICLCFQALPCLNLSLMSSQTLLNLRTNQVPGSCFFVSLEVLLHFLQSRVSFLASVNPPPCFLPPPHLPLISSKSLRSLMEAKLYFFTCLYYSITTVHQGK